MTSQVIDVMPAALHRGLRHRPEESTVDDRLLRSTLTANALLSGAAGVLLVALGGVLDEPLGIATGALRLVGVGLVPWAVSLWWARSRETLLRREAVTAIVGDTAWVVASVVVVVLAPAGLTALGQWVVGVTALAVGDLAVLQAVGLRRLAAEGRVSRVPTGRRPAAP